MSKPVQFSSSPFVKYRPYMERFEKNTKDVRNFSVDGAVGTASLSFLSAVAVSATRGRFMPLVRFHQTAVRSFYLAGGVMVGSGGANAAANWALHSKKSPFASHKTNRNV